MGSYELATAPDRAREPRGGSSVASAHGVAEGGGLLGIGEVELHVHALEGETLPLDLDHRLVPHRVPDDADGVLAAFHPLHLLHEHPAVHNDAAVRAAQPLG